MNYAQVRNNVGYDTDASGARTGTITLGGQNSPAIRMANLADGVLASDAATVGQVKQAKAEANAYTDSQVGALRDYTNTASTTSADRSATRGGRPGRCRRGHGSDSAPLPSAPGRQTYVFNASTFPGSDGYGGAIAYRFDTNIPLALTAGVSSAPATSAVASASWAVVKPAPT